MRLIELLKGLAVSFLLFACFLFLVVWICLVWRKKRKLRRKLSKRRMEGGSPKIYCQDTIITKNAGQLQVVKLTKEGGKVRAGEIKFDHINEMQGEFPTEPRIALAPSTEPTIKREHIGLCGMPKKGGRGGGLGRTTPKAKYQRQRREDEEARVLR